MSSKLCRSTSILEKRTGISERSVIPEKIEVLDIKRQCFITRMRLYFDWPGAVRHRKTRQPVHESNHCFPMLTVA